MNTALPLLAILASLGLTACRPAAPSSPTGRYVAKQVRTSSITMSGTVPTRETVSHEAEFYIHVWSRLTGYGIVPGLYLQGMEAWKIQFSPPPDYPPNTNVGECWPRENSDEAPIVLHEQVSRRVYVQLPSDNCTVRLFVVPLRRGTRHLTIRVYTRKILQSNGYQVSPQQYLHPRKIDRRTLILGAKLEWRAYVRA